MKDDLIRRLSDLRSRYNCFDDGERDAYHTLSEAIEALRQPEPCEDAISRQAAIDAVSRGCLEFRGIFAECEKNLNELPSVQPDTARRIVGKSRDGMTLWYQCDMCNEPVDAQDKFCRGCGRRLIGEKAVKNQPSVQPEQRWIPCDWCVYNPPSSMDGKPCTLCPAVANPE